MHLNHPKVTPVRGKLSSMKPVPGAKKVGGHCHKRESKELILSFLGSRDGTVDFKFDSMQLGCCPQGVGSPYSCQQYPSESDSLCPCSTLVIRF